MSDFDVFDREIYFTAFPINKKYCTKCGKEMDIFWNECPWCKSALGGQGEEG